MELKMRESRKKGTHSLQLLSKDAPFQFAEAYKSLRTNLQFASINKQYHKILVTSSIPGEGKSTVAINLAIAFADAGSSVLLIYTDLRKPTIDKYLQLSDFKSKGVTTLLAGIYKIDQCISFINDKGISVITSGPIPPNPAELLGSKKMEELVANLSEKFDYIIFDTPPISIVTDAALISKLADGVLFVIKQNYTSIESAALARKNLDNVGANIIGSVLNAAVLDKSRDSYASYRYKKTNYSYT
jgi:capsular exopolysaccharide synthesis family protein